MDYINAIIFGIIQGITEFLPISSSGHLVILHKFINLPIQNEFAFDVALHLATLSAVMWFFKKDILMLSAAWLKSFIGKPNEFSRISWLIILATIPAVLAGLLFEDIIESTLRSPMVVAIMLIAVGALFIILEKISRKTGELKNLNWKKVLIIGLAQAIALIPGTSRSGITIIAGLGAGLKRQAAIRFSFILSIPIIFGASIKKVPQIFGTGLAGNELVILIVAFVASFISGIFVIKYFLQFARKHSLNVFAIYRFILAGLIISLLYFCN
ncbi:MAG: undecaprenyl-diphosphatase UppP [Patescibacteria group bacterium]|nr:undecaprenyl-diphosphatase UppP [Patescibacteria group bacterium]